MMALRAHFIFSALFYVLALFAPYVAGQTTTTSAAATSSTSAPSRVEALRVCYGEGSICRAAADLLKACDNEKKAHGTDAYNECLCTSGYGAVDEA
jgi:hypothetical protein